MLNVPGGGVQTAAVARQLLGRDVQQQLGRQQIPAGGQTLQLAHRKAAQRRFQLALRHHQVAEGRGHHAALRGGGHVLPQLPQRCPQRFLHPARLADAHDGVRREIVKGRGLFWVHRRHIAVTAGGCHTLPQQRRVALQPLAQRTVLLLQPLGRLLDALRRLGGAVRRPAGQQLRRGQHRQRMAVLHPPLGVHGEVAHAVQLVVKELASHRLLRIRREHIQNAAPHRELPRAFHLVAPAVPGGGEMPGQRRHIVLPAHLQRKGGVLQHLLWDAPLHHAVYGGHHDGRAARHAVQRRQPAVLPLAAVRAGPQLQFPGGQHHRRLPRQGRQVRRLPPGLLLVGAQHQHRPPGLRQHRRRHHGPVNGGEPRHGGAPLPPRQGLCQLPYLGQRPYLLYQSAQGLTSFRVLQVHSKIFAASVFEISKPLSSSFKKFQRSVVAVHRFFRPVFDQI